MSARIAAVVFVALLALASPASPSLLEPPRSFVETFELASATASLDSAAPKLCFFAMNPLTFPFTGRGVPELVVEIHASQFFGTAVNATAKRVTLVTDPDGFAQTEDDPPLRPGTYLVQVMDPWGWYRPVVFGVELRDQPGCQVQTLEMAPASRPLPYTVGSFFVNPGQLGDAPVLGAMMPDTRTPELTLSGNPNEDPTLGPVLREVDPSTLPVVGPHLTGRVCFWPELSGEGDVPQFGDIDAIREALPQFSQYPRVDFAPKHQQCVSYQDGEVCATTWKQTPALERAPVVLTPADDAFYRDSILTKTAIPFSLRTLDLTGQDAVCRSEPDDEGAVGYVTGVIVDGSRKPGAGLHALPNMRVALQPRAAIASPGTVSTGGGDVVIADPTGPPGTGLLGGEIRPLRAAETATSNPGLITGALQEFPNVEGQFDVDHRGVPGVTVPSDAPGVGGERVLTPFGADPNALPLAGVDAAYEALGAAGGSLPAPLDDIVLSDHKDDRYRYVDLSWAEEDDGGRFLVACHRTGQLTPGTGMSLAFQDPAELALFQSIDRLIDCRAGETVDLGAIGMPRSEVTVIGEILNQATGAPVEGARVTSEHPGLSATRGLSITDEDGYKLPVPWSDPADEGPFTIRVQRQGFEENLTTVQVNVTDLATLAVPQLSPVDVLGVADAGAKALEPSLGNVDRNITSVPGKLRSQYAAVLAAAAFNGPADVEPCQQQAKPACDLFYPLYLANLRPLLVEQEQGFADVEKTTFDALVLAHAGCQVAAAVVADPEAGLDNATREALQGVRDQVDQTVPPEAAPVREELGRRSANATEDVLAALDGCTLALDATVRNLAPAVEQFERALFQRYLEALAEQLAAADEVAVPQRDVVMGQLDTVLGLLACPPGTDLADPEVHTCQAAADAYAVSAAQLEARLRSASGTAAAAELLAAFQEVRTAALAAVAQACPEALREAPEACDASPKSLNQLAVASAFGALVDMFPEAFDATAGLARVDGKEAFLAWARSQDQNGTLFRNLDAAWLRVPTAGGALARLLAEDAAGPLVADVRDAAVLIDGGETAAVYLAVALRSAAGMSVAPGASLGIPGTSRGASLNASDLGEGYSAVRRVLDPRQAAARDAVEEQMLQFGIFVRDMAIAPVKEMRRVVDLAGNPLGGVQVFLNGTLHTVTRAADGNLTDRIEAGVYDVRLELDGYEPRVCPGLSIPPAAGDDPDGDPHTCWVMWAEDHAAVVVQAVDAFAAAAPVPAGREIGPCGAKVKAYTAAEPPVFLGEAPLGNAHPSCPVASYRGALLDPAPPFGNGTGVIAVPANLGPVRLEVELPEAGYYAALTTAPLTLEAGTFHRDLRGSNALRLQRTVTELQVTPKNPPIPEESEVVAGGRVNVTGPRLASTDCSFVLVHYACPGLPWVDDPWGLGWPTGEYQFFFEKTSGRLFKSHAGPPLPLLPPLPEATARDLVVAPVPTVDVAGFVVDAHALPVATGGLPASVQATHAALPCDPAYYACTATAAAADGAWTMQLPDIEDLGTWTVEASQPGYQTRSDDLADVRDGFFALARVAVPVTVPVTDLASDAPLVGVPVSVQLDQGSRACKPDAALGTDDTILCEAVSDRSGLVNLTLPWGDLDVRATGGPNVVRYQATIEAPPPLGPQVRDVFDEAEFLGTAEARPGLDPGEPPAPVELRLPRALKPLAGLVTMQGGATPVEGVRINARPLIYPTARGPQAFCDPLGAPGDEHVCGAGIVSGADGRFQAGVPDANFRFAPMSRREVVDAAGSSGTTVGSQWDALDRQAGLAPVGGATGLAANLSSVLQLPEVWDVRAGGKAGFENSSALALDKRVSKAPLCGGALLPACALGDGALDRCVARRVDTTASALNICPQGAVDFVLAGLPQVLPHAIRLFEIKDGAEAGIPGARVCVSQPMRGADGVTTSAPGLPSAQGRVNATLEALFPHLLNDFAPVFPSNPEDCQFTPANGTVVFSLRYYVADAAQTAAGLSRNNVLVLATHDDFAPHVLQFEVAGSATDRSEEMKRLFFPSPQSCVGSSGAPEVCPGSRSQAAPSYLRAFVKNGSAMEPLVGDWVVQPPSLGNAFRQEGRSELDLANDPRDGDRADGTWIIAFRAAGAPVSAVIDLHFGAGGQECRTKPSTSPGGVSVWVLNFHRGCSGAGLWGMRDSEPADLRFFGG